MPGHDVQIPIKIPKNNIKKGLILNYKNLNKSYKKKTNQETYKTNYTIFFISKKYLLLVKF